MGQVLDGKFRLEARLRQERLATIYGATHLATGRPVSVKVLPLDGSGTSRLGALREQVTCLAAVRHPNVVEVIEAGVAEDPQVIYAATEFVDGVSLKKFLSERGPLSQQEAALVLRQLCSATEAVNSSGLLSQGLCPENIWLHYSNGSGPKVKIDFAWLSDPLTPETKARIHRGEIECDPTYLSPEECRGEDPDKRSDVYRLGLIAYEMLAGRPPFESDSVARLILMQLNDAPPPVETIAPQNGVPHLVEPAMMRALAKLAQYRHQSAAEFEKALEEAESSANCESRGNTGGPEPAVVDSHPPGTAGSILPSESTTESSVQIVGGSADTASGSEPATPDQPMTIEIVNEPVAVTGSVTAAENPATATEFVFDNSPTPPTNASRPSARQSGEKQDGPRNKPLYLDDNARFSVFSPKVLQPLVWSRMVSFAHLTSIEEIAPLAEAKLRAEIDQYQTVAQQAVSLASRDNQITIVPTVPGVEFNPPSVSFLWLEEVHSESFLMRASPRVDGQRIRGRVSVFLGSILIAEAPLNVRIESSYSAASSSAAHEQATSERFKKIYASYSLADTTIAAQFERIAEDFGEQYLRDVRQLRGTGAWGAKLEKLILEADVFQLLWSTSAISSELMRQEWEYALSLRRPGFVRPTYWEDPLPSSPQHHLPPEELTRLGFQRIANGPEASAAVTRTPSMTGSFGSGSLSTESNPRIPVAGTNGNSEFEFNETPPRAPEPEWETPEHGPEGQRMGQRVPLSPRLATSPSAAGPVVQLSAGQKVATASRASAQQPGMTAPAGVGVGSNGHSYGSYATELPYAPQMVQPAQPAPRAGSATLVLKVLVFVLSGCLFLALLLYLLMRYWR
jgi:serine/threonine protein kinase